VRSALFYAKYGKFSNILSISDLRKIAESVICHWVAINRYTACH
jgi:hypothetical protein